MGVITSAAPHSRSAVRAMSRSSASPPRRPMNWIPTGKPRDGAGTVIAGCPVRLNGRVKRAKGSVLIGPSSSGATQPVVGKMRASTSRIAASTSATIRLRSRQASTRSGPVTRNVASRRSRMSAPYFSGRSANHSLCSEPASAYMIARQQCVISVKEGKSISGSAAPTSVQTALVSSSKSVIHPRGDASRSAGSVVRSSLGTRSERRLIISSARAVVRTSRARGPTVSSDTLTGHTPSVGTHPVVGFIPTTPHIDAGIRFEPPVSVPMAQSHIAVATATADPPDDPPVTRRGSCGLRVVPKCAFMPVDPKAHSCMFVLPTTTTPSVRRSWITAASADAGVGVSTCDPAVVATSRTSMTSFTATTGPSPFSVVNEMKALSQSSSWARARA